MKHLDVLGTHDNFKYVLYAEDTEHLSNEYKKMYEKLKNKGFVLAAHWDLSGGILLEDEADTIAGIFFNTEKFSKSLLVHLSYVSVEYRKRGIYTKLHSFLDSFGKINNREDIYSYIHLENRPMVDYIGEKIGYIPVMQLVKRPVK